MAEVTLRDTVLRIGEEAGAAAIAVAAYDFELIFADNNSSDGTLAILSRLAGADGRVKVIANARNYGPFRSTFNALRYASGASGAIRVATRSGGAFAQLAVYSDGPPIEQGVQRHLFEPFFSSESRSSGLGLYICRELCERHGASIAYRRVSAADGRPEGNEFSVTFRAPASAGDRAPFATISA